MKWDNVWKAAVEVAPRSPWSWSASLSHCWRIEVCLGAHTWEHQGHLQEPVLVTVMRLDVHRKQCSWKDRAGHLLSLELGTADLFVFPGGLDERGWRQAVSPEQGGCSLGATITCNVSEAQGVMKDKNKFNLLINSWALNGILMLCW